MFSHFSSLHFLLATPPYICQSTKVTGAAPPLKCFSSVKTENMLHNRLASKVLLHRDKANRARSPQNGTFFSLPRILRASSPLLIPHD